MGAEQNDVNLNPRHISRENVDLNVISPHSPLPPKKNLPLENNF